MSSLFDKILAALFPRRCPVCGEWTEWASPRLCSQCAEVLASEYARPCPVCQKKAATCNCKPDTLSADSIPVITLGFYEPGNTNAVTSRLVYALKHRTDDAPAHVFARDLAGAILKEFLAANEDVRTWTFTYAPRSVLGYEQNGFDQAQRLARLCAHYTGAKYESVFRRRGGGEQKNLNRTEREKNAAASIGLRNPRRIYAEKYIVIDDIFTTGATLAMCADLLRTHGAESVRIAAPLRTLPRPPKKELWYAFSGKNIQ